MSVLVLEVESRNPAELSAKDVRSQGNLPGIYYGKGKDNIALQMDYQTFRKLFRQAGESSLVELNIDGGKRKEVVLIHDYQLHPVRDEFTHVDFLSVNMSEEITTSVHIEVVGVSPAVKDLGGTLAVPLQFVEVKCLPKDIPHHFELDVSVIEDFHTSLHVSDLKVPEGVEILTDAALTIANVAAPRSEEELAEAESSEAPEAPEMPGAEEEGDSEGEA